MTVGVIDSILSVCPGTLLAVPTGTALGVGLGLAAVTIVGAVLLPADAAFAALAVLLSLVAGVYVGFAILSGMPQAPLVQSIGALSFVLLGTGALVTGSAGLLAAGYGLHALWDLAHHPGPLDAGQPDWYTTACVVYDLAIGVFVVVKFA
jgi:hypothetical protein